MIRDLREAEALEAQGLSRAEVVQRLSVSEQTLMRWRQSFKGMGEDQIKRLKSLEDECRRLRKAVADLVLERQIIKEVMRGKG